MIGQIRSSVPSGPIGVTTLASTVLACALSCGRLGAADEPDKDNGDAAIRERLQRMQRSAAEYSIYPADDRKRLFKFHEDAALRYSNPTTGIKDGAIYLWSANGRPQ